MPTLDPKLNLIVELAQKKRTRALTDLNSKVEQPPTLSAPSAIPGARSQSTQTDTSSDDESVNAIVQLVHPSKVDMLREMPGVTVTAALEELVTIHATTDGLRQLEKSDVVAFVETARALISQQLDESGPSSEPVINVARYPTTHTGKGVIVGVVDWGCDFTHPDLRNDDGSSRIVSIWHQNAPGGPGLSPPEGFTDGVEYTDGAINTALGQSNPFEALQFPVPGIGSHGTHVTGLASGNGNAVPDANIRGTAPEADIIFVQPTNATTVLQGLGDSTHLVQALLYIFNTADELGRPAVINLSLGTNSGPHDGTSLVERWIDRLLDRPGRAIVLALGNEHQQRFIRTHAAGTLSDGQTSTLYWRTLPNDSSINEMEIWYNAQDRASVSLELPDGQILGPIVAGSDPALHSVPGTQTQVYIDSQIHSRMNGDNVIYLVVVAPDDDSEFIEEGVWQVKLLADHVVVGTFDAWIERDGFDRKTNTFRSSFIGGSYLRSKTLGSIQSARYPITVSNYDEITVTLADSTSVGPTRDGRLAPTLAAPGVNMLAAKSRFDDAQQEAERVPYVAMTGTSMSAPVVTGVVACMLEKNPTLNAVQLRSILASSAKFAPGLQPGHRPDWGYGRLDPVAALEQTPIAPPSV